MRLPCRWSALIGCLSLLSVATVSARAGIDGLRPVHLLCEYRTDPMGLDVVQPRLSWGVQSADSQARDQRQTAYRILVSDNLAELTADHGNLWESDKVASSQSLHVVYGGKPLQSGVRCYWKVRVWDERGRPSPYSATARWTMGLLHPSDWKAQWVVGKGPAFPWIRKTFTIEGEPRRGTAYVCVMGYYELYVNGNKVGDEALVPAVSDYTKRALYLTYDISEYLREGKNCVALWLGRGWYVPGTPGAIQENPPALVQLALESAQGRQTTIGTDATWKAYPSPISFIESKPSRLGPQCYDARGELSGWNDARLDDSAWGPVRTIAAPAVEITAQACEPNRVIEIIRPIGVEEPAPGTYLVDMGRLFSGGFEIGLEGPRGAKVRFEYVEHRGPSGQMQTYNQAEEYIFRGGAEETFRTRLTYHAFRWVLVKGLPRKPNLKAVRGLMITTDMPRTARFKCSNDLLNRIYETTLWTYRCLSLGGYTVDCPHRERLGYGGDAHATMETAMSNLAAAAFYTKWLTDWRDAQQPNGDLPHVAPPVTFAGGGPAWSGICVTLP